MELTTIFVTVALAHFLALLSPGPDFVLVVKSAIRHPARVAAGVAVGIATGNALYIALCLAGVGALLSRSTGLMLVLKIGGGLFLAWLGWMALRARKSDYAALAALAAQEGGARPAASPGFWRECVVGFASALLNPKNLLFYLSLFSLVLNSEVALVFKLALGGWMTAVVLVWDLFIILVLSHPPVRAWFSRAAYYIDKFTGLVLGAVGGKIVHGAISQP
ncbi:lysine transporter LysE [Corticibacter populi]|uniref:Lysine transporter LysE n=1 Tax=Corticibacter populi TaxID=1550736 RepID=A0A3M6QZB1_9BURK|nr:LysE family transporter [Corticibacter populi]RMX08357.1 lysine transporter LysE [Corticibacter populi]RZS35650.1 threonine/homoserine/homoserine lactone efflux protein [Corticibacter populi]